MSRLDAEKFCRLEFIVNFGVPMMVKSSMTALIEENASERKVCTYLDELEPLTLLKLHKYFFWADKKLHSVFFIENKDDITEDLLHEFRDEDSKKRFVKAQDSLASKKQNVKTGKAHQVEQAQTNIPSHIDLEHNKNKITREDLLFGNSKKKYVMIDDEDDFPDLDMDGNVPAKQTKVINRG